MMDYVMNQNAYVTHKVDIRWIIGYGHKVDSKTLDI